MFNAPAATNRAKKKAAARPFYLPPTHRHTHVSVFICYHAKVKATTTIAQAAEEYVECRRVQRRDK